MLAFSVSMSHSESVHEPLRVSGCGRREGGRAPASASDGRQSESESACGLQVTVSSTGRPGTRNPSHDSLSGGSESNLSHESDSESPEVVTVAGPGLGLGPVAPAETPQPRASAPAARGPGPTDSDALTHDKRLSFTFLPVVHRDGGSEQLGGGSEQLGPGPIMMTECVTDATE